MLLGFLINIVVGVLLNAASTLLQQAFGAQDKARSGGTRGSAQMGGKVPQYFLMGTVAEPGKREYRNSWGEVDGVPNAYDVDVYSFGDLPITAMVGLFVNSVAEPIAASGKVAQGFPSVGDKAGVFWAEFFNGTQTAPSSYLTTTFGNDPDRPWLADMVGRGVPYLTTTALWEGERWTGFPNVVGEFQGIKLYDPRQDSTAGGLGSQRWANPSTWGFSDNNAVMIYNIERGIYYSPAGATTLGEHVWGGKKSAAELPYAVWAAAMNACDEGVSLANGAWEKRFRAGRRVDMDERPADVIKELLIGANARISHAADGQVYILVGVPSVADGAFSDADVLATEPIGSIPFPNLDEIVNGATATYREPTQAWEDKETSPYYRSDLEAQDDGRRQVQGLDLGTTFSGTQAQRILKAVVEEGRRFKRHVVALPPDFAVFRPLQVLAWTNGKYGYNGKLFLITARTISPWGQVVFGLQEIDPADHQWVPANDERPINFSPVVINRPVPQEVSGFYVEPAIALDAQGRPRRPAIDVFWSATSVTVDVAFVRISHRLAGETADRWVGLIPRPQLLTGSARLVEALLPNEQFEVQIQYLPASGRATIASGWLPVTTPDIRLTSLDVALDELAAEVKEDVAELDTWARFNTRETIEEKRRLALLNVAGAVGDFNDRQLIRREASSTYLLSKAEWTEDILVATGPTSALSLRIEELRTEVFDPVSGLPATNEIVSLLSAEINDPGTGLEATNNSILSLTSTVGQFSAGGLLRIQTVATASGASATAALGISASSGGAMGNAAIYLNALADGSSSLFLVANRVAVRAGPSTSPYGIFAIDNGVVWFDEGRIRNLTAVNLSAGAITAGKIAAGAINASSLFVNGVVITDLIAQNAVTDANLVSSQGEVEITSAGNSVTLQTMVIAPTGNRLIVRGSAVVYSIGGARYGGLRLYKDGVEFAYAPLSVDDIPKSQFTVVAVDNNPSPATWTLQLVNTSGGGTGNRSVYAVNRYIEYLNGKR